MDSKLLRQTALAGAVLAVVGIILFVVIWMLLGNTETSQFTRVVLSVCTPPILMAAGLGVYFLVRPSGEKSERKPDQ